MIVKAICIIQYITNIVICKERTTILFDTWCICITNVRIKYRSRFDVIFSSKLLVVDSKICCVCDFVIDFCNQIKVCQECCRPLIFWVVGQSFCNTPSTKLTILLISVFIQNKVAILINYVLSFIWIRSISRINWTLVIITVTRLIRTGVCNRDVCANF